MTEQERQPYHDKANKIAEDAWPAINAKEAQARNAVRKPLQLDSPGTLWSPSEKQIGDMNRYLGEASTLRERAMEKIEREVIDKLPPHATAKDKQLIRDGACDILGIPPDKRGQEDKSKGADATRETPASPNVSQSRFTDYPPKDAQNPDVAQERHGAESSRFLKQIGVGGSGGGTPPTPKGPTKDER